MSHLTTRIPPAWLLAMFGVGGGSGKLLGMAAFVEGGRQRCMAGVGGTGRVRGCSGGGGRGTASASLCLREDGGEMYKVGDFVGVTDNFWELVEIRM